MMFSMGKWKNSTVVLLLFWLTFAWVSGNDGCPPEIMIEPCTCSPEFIPIVLCNNVTNVEKFEGVFQKSADWPFSSFVLNNSNVMYIPGSVIQTKKMFYLSILNTTMSAIFDAAPESPNDLELIVMQNVDVKRGIDWRLFRHLDKLALFQAENVEIRSLGKSFVANINKKLVSLFLAKTKTRKLHDLAFQQMKDLFTIKINDAEISTLKRSMFAMPANLSDFNFQGNRIQTLPNDMFVNMPKLENVVLANNEIQVVSETVFGRIGRAYAVLTGNPVMCDCSFKWIVQRNDQHFEGTCANPLDKKGKDFQLLTANDFYYC